MVAGGGHGVPTFQFQCGAAVGCGNSPLENFIAKVTQDSVENVLNGYYF